MAQITATMVKELRDSTGLGMMDCKKALEENSGDIAAANDWLRAKGLATAEKKSGRATKEGLVAIKIADDNKSAAIVEVQCETDFCARNEEFQKMAASVLEMAFAADDGKIEATDAITACVQETFSRIGENMSYAGGMKLSGDQIGSYMHHNNKVGVVVALKGSVDEEIITGLCQHIAFANPMGLTSDDIPADIVAKEREIAKQQAIESGKPEAIAEKMVEGKIRKFLAERALVEQQYVKDDKKKIKEILGDAQIVAFARFAVGGE